ncbi:MAG: hypothetical protein HKN08_09420, partial [Gammaproteobacteria bacterium]|nr:hypothetical protein [Gammaproteobacteria bacterium]
MFSDIYQWIVGTILSPLVSIIVPEVFQNEALLLLGILVKIVAILVPLLLSVAYLTYAERKIIGYIQCRIGPNRVGFLGYKLIGLGQPFADAFKLIFKEIIIPSGANKTLFIMAPILSFAPSIAAWAV